jgi:hypothetical protein
MIISNRFWDTSYVFFVDPDDPYPIREPKRQNLAGSRSSHIFMANGEWRMANGEWRLFNRRLQHQRNKQENGIKTAE